LTVEVISTMALSLHPDYFERFSVRAFEEQQ